MTTVIRKYRFCHNLGKLKSGGIVISKIKLLFDLKPHKMIIINIKPYSHLRNIRIIQIQVTPNIYIYIKWLWHCSVVLIISFNQVREIYFLVQFAEYKLYTLYRLRTGLEAGISRTVLCLATQIYKTLEIDVQDNLVFAHLVIHCL